MLNMNTYFDKWTTANLASWSMLIIYDMMLLAIRKVF